MIPLSIERIEQELIQQSLNNFDLREEAGLEFGKAVL